MRHPIRLSQVISALIVVLLFLLVVQSFMFRQGTTETVLLGVLAGLMAVVVMQSATWSSRAAVEYKVISGNAFEEGALLQLGKEGWRLTGIDDSASRYFFTR